MKNLLLSLSIAAVSSFAYSKSADEKFVVGAELRQDDARGTDVFILSPKLGGFLRVGIVGGSRIVEYFTESAKASRTINTLGATTVFSAKLLETDTANTPLITELTTSLVVGKTFNEYSESERRSRYLYSGGNVGLTFTLGNSQLGFGVSDRVNYVSDRIKREAQDEGFTLRDNSLSPYLNLGFAL